MKATLDALDERLRRLLAQPCGRAARIACAALVLLGFAGVMMTRSLALGHHAATAVMMCLPLAAMLVFAMRIAREHEQGALGALLLGALCAAAMLARVSFLERSSGDYEIYLADWLQKLAGGSFAEGMRQNIGEYNVLYQYILFVITRLPVPPLYAVKAVSFIGDAFLAGAAATLAQKDGKKSAAAFGLAMLLPTVALNGGMFAQCDSLYAACALWGLALALERKSAGAAACFALSLAFKLQAVFLLPMVAVLWADRKLRLSDALVFLAALAVTALPALLGGKSIGALLSIYTAQTGLYTGLTYNAPSFFALMNTTGLDVYAYGNFGKADAGRVSASGSAAAAGDCVLPAADARAVFLSGGYPERRAGGEGQKGRADLRAGCAGVAGQLLGDGAPAVFLRADDVCRADFDAKAYPTGRKCDIIDQRQQNVTFPGKEKVCRNVCYQHKKANKMKTRKGWTEDFSMNRDEMLNFLKNEARGISVMFGPNCETIVHDMTRPGHPILAIFNGTVTGREVGSTADIFGDIGDYDESIYQNKDYINQMVLSRDGRTLKSSTFNIVGEDYHFALGINLDITNMVRAGQMLSELTATSGDLQQTLMQDARSQLEELLRECISAVGKEPEAMKKTDRMRIIRMLYKRRAFTYQKSVAIVAERLNVSRYTVYKYMHELEEAEAAGSLVQD